MCEETGREGRPLENKWIYGPPPVCHSLRTEVKY